MPPTGRRHTIAGGLTVPMTADTSFRELRSARLRLRRFHPDDLDAFVAYRSDPEIARYQGWGPGFDRAAGTSFVEWAIGADPGVPDEWFQFAIERLDEPGLIGDCAARFGVEIEVGFTLAAAHHGHGYATEAVRTLLDYLRAEGHRQAVAWCDVRNAPSAAVLGRLGFRVAERVDGEDRYTLTIADIELHRT